MFFRSICLTLFGFVLSHLASAQKTDKVLLTDGDWITGEIKKLDFGKVTFKTNAAGTINVKWENIYMMRSDKFFEVRLNRGLTYYGAFDTTGRNFEVKLLREDTIRIINMNRIVEFNQIKDRFWARLDGNADIGYSYTKGSQVSQLNGSLRLTYRHRNSYISAAANTIITEQPERATSRKQDANLSYRYNLGKNFDTNMFTVAEQNTELGVDLRLSLGGGLSKNWFRSNTMRLYTTLGALVNRESTDDLENNTTNYEGIFIFEYKIFRYRDPEIDLTTSYAFIPSFTVSGRYRGNFDTKIQYEIFKDFYLGLTFYHTLDSKPQSETALSKTDWGIVTSIGYSW